MPEVIRLTLSLILAGVLGGLVGYERELHEHPAGLRTHILVCLGSALITIVSASYMPPVGDPTRITAQIVSGIGFLGAGTILRRGNVVHGLTTAASLWTVAAIGISVGVHGGFSIYAGLATIATLIVFLTLAGVRRLEPWLGKGGARELRLAIAGNPAEVLVAVLRRLEEMGIGVSGSRSIHADGDGGYLIRLRVVIPRGMSADGLVGKLAEQAGVIGLEWG